MDLESGARVDRYVLIKPLGQGGQGAVWQARDPLEKDRPLALKLVRLVMSRPNDVERVRREARALARLAHPSLLKCHALFEDLKLELLGLAVDFVDGVSLNAARADPRLTARHRRLALSHIASALAYVHAAGVVHRDLKLDNVLLDNAFYDAPEDPRHLKLVDFGIALVDDGSMQPLTALGHVVGTPAYMAPEIIDPGHFKRSAPASAADIFAFGVLAYRLLYDEHPGGDSATRSLIELGVEYRRLAELAQPWPKSHADPAWDQLIRDCLKLRDGERIADGNALTERLDQIQSEPLSVAPAVAAAEAATSQEPSMRNRSAASAHSIVDPGAPTEHGPMSKPTSAIGPRESQASVPEPERPSVPRQVLADASAQQGSGKGLAIMAAFITVAILGVGGYVLFGPRDTEPRPLPTATHAPSSSPQLPLAPHAPRADGGEAGARALPLSCRFDAGLCECCPSGRDCGGACNDALPDDLQLELSAASVTLKSDETDELKSPEVCLKLKDSDDDPSCSHPLTAGTADAPPHGKTLALSVRQLRSAELEVKLWDRSVSPVARAEKLDAKLPPLTRAVLCQGVELVGFEGIGVEKIRLYVDELGHTPAERCPLQPEAR